MISKQGQTREMDEAHAVADLRRQVGMDGASVVVVFCSPAYDLERLGPMLKSAFSAPVVGCTTAGQIGKDGFDKLGIVAVSFSLACSSVNVHLVEPLSCSEQAAEAIGTQLLTSGAALPHGWKSFGLLLIDGLAMMEERVSADLFRAVGNVPIVGGSAGDDLAFGRTHVLTDGRFRSNAAVLTIVSTSLPFHAFKLQHFVPTSEKLVVTDAEPEARKVYTLNGEPAASAYARIIGVKGDDASRHFLMHPLMVGVGDEHYIRAVQRIGEDDSMTLYSAIDVGDILTVGRAVGATDAVRNAIAKVAARVGPPEVILGCDCVLRRLEFEQNGLDEAMGALYSANKVVGFSTYGEQFNGLHVNQTFAGIAIGSERP